jgi:hypothetical protein
LVSEHQQDGKDPCRIPIINFLADGHTRLNWSLATLESYRSTILDMFENREHIRDSFAHRPFFQAVQKTNIRTDRSRPVDISPVLQYFRNLGSNGTMALMDLTTKLCWHLGVCGFLRLSDIERIDLRECDWTSQTDRLSLLIIGPKENCLGQRIQKFVHIRGHPDPLLCPVATFPAYHQRHAFRPGLNPIQRFRMPNCTT